MNSPLRMEEEEERVRWEGLPSHPSPSPGEKKRVRVGNEQTYQHHRSFFSGFNRRTAMAAEAIQAGHAALSELFSNA